MMIQKCINLLSVLLVFAVVGCGGGTDLAGNGIGSGGTGSYTSGPVSGLGSIIVNGVRYDVEDATVVDDDGTPGFNQSSLQLGMFVEVQGSEIAVASGGDDADEGTATLVRVASDFVGPAQSIQRNGDGDITSFTVFGRTIRTDLKTVYSAAIANGDHVAVYGLVSDGEYKATRVQRLGVSTFFKLTGKVSSWNASTKQFGFGGRTFEYANSSDLPAGFDVGSWVRVRVLAINVLFSPIPVQTVKLAAAAVTTTSQAARLKGLIGVLDSATSFVVNGVRVNASGATGLPVGGLQVFDRVEVRGRLVNGVLVAQSVDVEDDAEVEVKKIELHGRASMVGSTTFVVKGMTIYFVPFEGPVADNECVQVRGERFNQSFQLVATEVRRNQTDCR